MDCELSTNNQFANLPSEVIQFIFSSPELRNSLGELALVCKDWHSIVKQLRSQRSTLKFVYDARIFEGSVSNVVQHFSRPTNLIIECPTTATVHWFFRTKFSQLTNIISLTIKTAIVDVLTISLLDQVVNLRYFSYHPDSITGRILEALTVLPNLQFVQYTFPETQTNCIEPTITLCGKTNLLHLNLNDPFPRGYRLNSSELEALGRHCSNLQTLTLDKLEEGCEYTISQVHSSQLERFSVVQLRNRLEEQLIIDFCKRHCNTLRILGLHGRWFGRKNDFPPEFGQQLTRIEYFSFASGMMDLINRQCALLAQYCQSLRVLRIFR